MSDRPSYLGLLNAISLGETNAGKYLGAWAACTKDPDVQGVLATVALRETEHGIAFEKRMCELGYGLRQRPDTEFEGKMRVATADCTDREKFEAMGLGTEAGDRPDLFDDIFKDHSIDIQTGALLGRYVAEERDSGRLLRGCYEVLCRREGRQPNGRAASSGGVTLDQLCAAVERLTGSVERMQRELTPVRNGGARA